MFKIIKAEIKKTFAKQGIYILTGILIIVLFACALLYSPAKKDDPIDVLKVNIEKRCSSDATKVTVNDIYNFFKSDNTYVSAQKLSEDVDNLENYVNFYYNLFYTESAVDDSIVTFDTLVNKYENIKQAFSDYSNIFHLFYQGVVKTYQEHHEITPDLLLKKYPEFKRPWIVEWLKELAKKGFIERPGRKLLFTLNEKN